MNPIRKTFTYGDAEVTLETGRVARQADGAVLVTSGNTAVLCTVVAAKEAAPGQDFFPLSVHYQEKYYAAGRIPGGYLKREGRPSEKETLTSRLIDRPIRPLFPNGYLNEVQVVCTVMSADKNQDPDIAALIGTSAALAVAGIPFQGPIGAARVSFSPDKGYVLNPSISDTQASSLDMVVAGTKEAVLMVESEAQELTEDQMLGAVLFGHDEMQKAIAAIEEFQAMVGVTPAQWTPVAGNEALKEQVAAAFSSGIAEAYRVKEKLARYAQIDALKSQALEQFANESTDVEPAEVAKIFSALEKGCVRQRIINAEPRIDGRDHKTVRPISVEIGVLPNTHGSALFTRGETQAMVVATLGSARDVQMVETLSGTQRDAFMLHYNFPPYCVGETGRMGGTGRREIGHGRLARRGVGAVLPGETEFPYSIRVVSEITESNGSSSMASVCGSSLALMDAGVPLKAPVAGIAMGLVKEGDQYAVLTDIMGDEDHLGDMDFKVAGTANGVTALQMDIKIDGITEEIMEIALSQAHTARQHILQEMSKVIDASRPEISANAPTMTSIKINADKIRDVIGKGGATIRNICETTGAEIDIDDSGTVKVFADSKSSADAAIKMIEAIVVEPEIGTVYQGKVERIVDFGAFVSIMPGVEGLVHISQVSDKRIEKVSDHLQEGQAIPVKLMDIDNRGRLKLSMKEVTAEDLEALNSAE